METFEINKQNVAGQPRKIVKIKGLNKLEETQKNEPIFPKHHSDNSTTTWPNYLAS